MTEFDHIQGVHYDFVVVITPTTGPGRVVMCRLSL